MMNDHEIGDSNQMVDSEYVIHHRRGMAAHVPKYHSLWLQSVGGSHATPPSTYHLVAVLRSVLGCSVGLRR